MPVETFVMLIVGIRLHGNTISRHSTSLFIGVCDCFLSRIIKINNFLNDLVNFFCFIHRRTSGYIFEF
jgi:hypothetical protein